MSERRVTRRDSFFAGSVLAFTLRYAAEGDWVWASIGAGFLLLFAIFVIDDRRRTRRVEGQND